MTTVNARLRHEHELQRHQALSRVKRLSGDEMASFLEFLATADPATTETCLNQFDGKAQTTRSG